MQIFFITLLIVFSFSENISAKEKQTSAIQKDLTDNSTTITPVTNDTKNKVKKTDAEKEAEYQQKLKESDKRKTEYIEKTLKFGIHKERREAIALVPSIRDEVQKNKLTDLLIETLPKEKDANVIIKILYTLSELTATKAVPGILFHLDNESEDVRIAAVFALKQLNATETKGKLIETLKNIDLSIDSNYTNGIIQTISAFKAVEMADFAEKKIEDNKTTKNIRAELFLFLGNINTPSTQSFLLKVFNDPNEELEIRSYAVNGLAKNNVIESIPSIKKTINEIESYSFDKKKRYYTFYIYCVTALTKMGDPEAYSRLEESLRSDNSQVRLQAIKLIGELKDKRSIDLLKYKAEYDSNSKVQALAKKILKDFGIDFKPELSGDIPVELKSSKNQKDNLKKENTTEDSGNE